MKEKSTPLTDMKTAERFPAHVVEPGSAEHGPRLHGYDLHDDLARHYSLAETLLLALTGELPVAADAVAFERALLYLMETPVVEGPTHAARTTMVGRGGPAAVVSVGAIALTAQARADLEILDALVEVLTGETKSPAQALRPANLREREAVSRLRSAMPWDDLGFLAHDLGLVPAILTVFYRVGLQRPEQMLVALVQGRLTTTVAEAFGDYSRAFSGLPNNLPRFDYRAPEQAHDDV